MYRNNPENYLKNNPNSPGMDNSNFQKLIHQTKGRAHPVAPKTQHRGVVMEAFTRALLLSYSFWWPRWGCRNFSPRFEHVEFLKGTFSERVVVSFLEKIQKIGENIQNMLKKFIVWNEASGRWENNFLEDAWHFDDVSKSYIQRTPMFNLPVQQDCHVHCSSGDFPSVCLKKRYTSTGRKFALVEGLSHDLACAGSNYHVHFAWQVWHGQYSPGFKFNKLKSFSRVEIDQDHVD